MFLDGARGVPLGAGSPGAGVPGAGATEVGGAESTGAGLFLTGKPLLGDRKVVLWLGSGGLV